MSILKELPELIKAEVISPETADEIRLYYEDQKGHSTNKLFIAFGVLGAILVGLGIILIMAHNWDELSRISKTIFSFLPLLIGQILCGFVLLKKQNNIAWRESTSAFLFFAVGASIALIGQIYNIPGNLSSFLLTWMLLCLPLIYVMNSSFTSLLYIAGITYYACVSGYMSSNFEPYTYWILLLLVLPYYYYLLSKKSNSNFTTFHNWIIPLSLIIALGTIAHRTEELLFVGYCSLFGVLYLVGHLNFFNSQKMRNNGYKILGSLGTVGILLGLSFDWFWETLRRREYSFSEIMVTPEFVGSVIVSLIALILFGFHIKSKGLKDMKPIAPIFILFIITFMIGCHSAIAVVLINLFLFTIGVMTIREGANINHLGILNYGLIIITALVACRFFDTELSFVIRGILFVFVGIGFFATNYWMIKTKMTIRNQ